MTGMTIDNVGYTPAQGYGYTRVALIRGSGVPAIEKARAAVVEALDAYDDVKRRRDSARVAVERFDELAQAEAIVAGAAGERFDVAASREKKATVTQALKDLELETLSASSFLSRSHADYQTALSENLDALRKVARDQATDCSLRLSTALEMTRGAQTRLDAALAVMAGASELAVGMPVPANAAPREASDDFDDSGYPNVLASVAAGELERSLGWLARWIARADEQAAERKAAIKSSAGVEG
ncbi:MAG: hypothetical protein PIR02_11860 [Microbacterium enclense]